MSTQLSSSVSASTGPLSGTVSFINEMIEGKLFTKLANLIYYPESVATLYEDKSFRFKSLVAGSYQIQSECEYINRNHYDVYPCDHNWDCTYNTLTLNFNKFDVLSALWNPEKGKLSVSAISDTEIEFKISYTIRSKILGEIIRGSIPATVVFELSKTPITTSPIEDVVVDDTEKPAKRTKIVDE